MRMTCKSIEKIEGTLNFKITFQCHNYVNYELILITELTEYEIGSDYDCEIKPRNNLIDGAGI